MGVLRGENSQKIKSFILRGTFTFSVWLTLISHVKQFPVGVVEALNLVNADQSITQNKFRAGFADALDVTGADQSHKLHVGVVGALHST